MSGYVYEKVRDVVFTNDGQRLMYVHLMRFNVTDSPAVIRKVKPRAIKFASDVLIRSIELWLKGNGVMRQ